MGQITIDRYIREFDNFNWNDSNSISYQALEILNRNKILSKYKLIFPLFKSFSFNANSIVLDGYAETPLWALDYNDRDLIRRVNEHSSYKKGISDAYCMSSMGTSVLIMQKGTVDSSVKIRRQGYDEDSYKIHLETGRNTELRITEAVVEEVEVNDLRPLEDIIVQYADSELAKEFNNNQSFLEGVKSHYPIVQGGRYVIYYFFPNNVATKNGKYGFGGIFVVAHHYINKSEISFFMMLAFAMSNKVALMQYKKMRVTETVKSVKAAIMSRNMSHNLGSHIMAYLKQNLSSVQEMINSRSLCNLVNRDDSNVSKSVNSIEMPFLIGVGKFIKYIQERQDYIATVATDYIPYSSSVNFKDYIFDELNADLRFLRHKGDRSGCQPQNILLDNIAKSEGYSREDIHINFRNFDGGIELLNFEEIQLLEKYPNLHTDEVLRQTLSETETNLRKKLQGNKDLESLRTLNVSLPGGVIGRQAIFSIVENIIRNAAKHGKFNSQNKQLDVIFDLKDLNNHSVIEDLSKDEYYYKLLEKNKYFEELNKNRYYIFTITNNQLVDDETISLLSSAINECYVKDDGSINNTNKGIKEMRISASWLRNIHDDNDARSLADSGEPPIIMVDNTTKFLRYTMCLCKAFKVAMVVDCKVENSINEEKTLEKYAWRVYTSEEWIKKTTNREYEIIIVQSNVKQGIKDISPNRLIEINDEYHTIIEDIRKKDMDIQQYLEKKYIEYWRHIVNPREDDIIYIDDLSLFQSCKEKGGVPVIGKINGKERVVEYTFCKDQNGQYMVRVLGNLPQRDMKNKYKEAKYVYRKHHALQSELQQYFEYFINEENVKSPQFVEGITGHNSTDRLIRNEYITELWYLKHLRAVKTKVAIFDERIFRKLSLKEEKTILKELEENDGVLACSTMLPIVYAHKRVSVYTIIPNNLEKNEFVILGLCCEKQNVSIRKIGDIRFSDDEFVINMVYSEVNKNDYMSVHQGLLDKLYEAIPYSVKYDNNEYNAKRIHLTDLLKTIFCNDRSRMLIHSGRSIPSDKDMPQRNVPFVQFATIENALEDAKLTLVELLDFARCDS